MNTGSLLTDKLKNWHVVGGTRFLKHHVSPFWNYCQDRGLSKADVMKLNPKDRLKLVLRWKWFTDDWVSAKECESTRQEVLQTMAQMPPTDEGTAYWYKNALGWEAHVRAVKAEVGIGPIDQPDWKKEDDRRRVQDQE